MTTNRKLTYCDSLALRILIARNLGFETTWELHALDHLKCVCSLKREYITSFEKESINAVEWINKKKLVQKALARYNEIVISNKIINSKINEMFQTSSTVN